MSFPLILLCFKSNIYFCIQNCFFLSFQKVTEDKAIPATVAMSNLNLQDKDAAHGNSHDLTKLSSQHSRHQQDPAKGAGHNQYPWPRDHTGTDV